MTSLAENADKFTNDPKYYRQYTSPLLVFPEEPIQVQNLSQIPTTDSNTPSRGKLQGRKYTISTGLKIAYGIGAAAVVAGLIATVVFGTKTNSDWPKKIVYPGLFTSVGFAAAGALGFIGTATYHLITLKKDREDDPVDWNASPF